MIKGLIAGSFELIHPGYIRLFKDAKRVCDYLVVALQDDPSIDRPKTKMKPIFSKEERMEILMAIKYVDEVRFYQTEGELTLLIMDVQPNIRIVGSDYIGRNITGRGLTKLYYHNREHNWSVTKMMLLLKENQ